MATISTIALLMVPFAGISILITINRRLASNRWLRLVSAILCALAALGQMLFPVEALLATIVVFLFGTMAVVQFIMFDGGTKFIKQ